MFPSTKQLKLTTVQILHQNSKNMILLNNYKLSSNYQIKRKKRKTCKLQLKICADNSIKFMTLYLQVDFQHFMNITNRSFTSSPLSISIFTLLKSSVLYLVLQSLDRTQSKRTCDSSRTTFSSHKHCCSSTGVLFLLPVSIFRS